MRMIRQVLTTDSPYSDSLSGYFPSIGLNSTYSLKTGGFENLKNRGFEIIDNNSVRKSITDLYDTHYTFIKESQLTADRLTYDYFLPNYLQFFDEVDAWLVNDSKNRAVRYTPKNWEALKTDKDFDRLLGFLLSVKNENIFSLMITIEEIQRTKRSVIIYLQSLTRR